MNIFLSIQKMPVSVYKKLRDGRKTRIFFPVSCMPEKAGFPCRSFFGPHSWQIVLYSWNISRNSFKCGIA